MLIHITAAHKIFISSFTVFLLKSKDLQSKKSYLETLYEFQIKCNPDTKPIQTLVVPMADNSLEVIDRACSSEHCNDTVWNESVHLHCWLLKIPPRLYLLFFSHCLERRKKKKKLRSVSLHHSHMCRLHLVVFADLLSHDREDDLSLLWYLFLTWLEFFDISSNMTVASFGLLNA